MKAFYERYWNDKLPPMKLFGDPPSGDEGNVNRSLELIVPWLLPEDTVLDYGCGEGFILNGIVQKIGLPARQCVGVDISDTALMKARARFPGLDFRRLEDFTARVSVITTFDVMEHIFDFDEVFDFFRSRLKIHGHLLIATNEMCFLKMAAIGVFYMDTFFHPYSPHIRFFTRNTLRDLLAYHGFKVIHYDRIANHFGFLSTGQFVAAERIR